MEQLSLFENKNKKPIPKSKLPIILNASRMTDMPRYYPNGIIAEVEKRLEKGADIHTLVFWTKHPKALLAPKLYAYIEKLKRLNIQIYLQCTITGMGQKIIGKDKHNKDLILEPNSPTPEEALSCLKDVIDLIESPLRIRMRIDPLVRIQSNMTKEIYTNLNYVKPIVAKASELGVKNFSISFLEENMHRKVDKRFETLGWTIIPPNKEERMKTVDWLSNISNKYDVNIYACSVSGLPESRCVDGYLLQSLHPAKRPARLDEPRKRKRCACTHSIDIGGWPPKKCYTGCQYCYANSSYK